MQIRGEATCELAATSPLTYCQPDINSSTVVRSRGFHLQGVSASTDNPTAICAAFLDLAEIYLPTNRCLPVCGGCLDRVPPLLPP